MHMAMMPLETKRVLLVADDAATRILIGRRAAGEAG
jgi:hypothetical protein